MTGVVPINPKQQFHSGNGDPLSNGTVTVYLAGTTTLATTYQDRALSIANTNPIVLNARGECSIWVDSGNSYKYVVKDSAGVTIYTEDNIPGTADIGTAVSAAQDWATKVDAPVITVPSNEYSAKEYAQGTQAGTGGSAKAWAQSATLPDGVSKSSKSYALDSAASASAAANSATEARNAATSSLNGIFASTADALSKGVTAATGIVGGAGGTNGTFDVAFSGGAGSGAAARFVVAGGALTSIVMTASGRGYTSAPTMSFAASAGLAGASATAVIANNVDDGEYFSVPSALSSGLIDLYKNVGGVATFVKSYPSSEILSPSTGSNVHYVWTDSADKALMSLKDNGLHVYTGGTDVTLTGAPSEIESNSATTALFGREDSRGKTIEAIDQYGRPYWLGLGSVFDRIPTSDVCSAMMRESWGETSYKNYLVDKALSALGRRVYIHKKLVSDMADANVSSARYPFYIPITDTSGLLLFSQRHISHNNGEELQRQVCRSITIDPTVGTITTGATVIVDEPPGWLAGTGGNAAGAVGVRLPSGRIVIVYNWLKSNFYSDPAWEHVLMCRYSDDNGATWSPGVEIMRSADIYTALGAPAGGITSAVPARNGVYTGTGNCILRIPSGTYAGRLVCGIYTEGLWFGSMYSDDDGATWTRGTLEYSGNVFGGKIYGENAITFCSDGSLVMLQRCESSSGGSPNMLLFPGNGRRVSTNGGQSWTYTSHVDNDFGNSSISLVNASLSSATGFEKLVAACNADPLFFNRQQHSIRISYDKGVTWVADVRFFPLKQGVGYGSLTRLSNGDYLFVYETFNGDGAINTQPSVGAIYFNEAELLASSTLV